MQESKSCVLWTSRVAQTLHKAVVARSWAAAPLWRVFVTPKYFIMSTKCNFWCYWYYVFILIYLLLHFAETKSPARRKGTSAWQSPLSLLHIGSIDNIRTQFKYQMHTDIQANEKRMCKHFAQRKIKNIIVSTKDIVHKHRDISIPFKKNCSMYFLRMFYRACPDVFLTEQLTGIYAIKLLHAEELRFRIKY